MNYEKGIEYLAAKGIDEFFSLFHFLRLAPRRCMSHGKEAISLLGYCHYRGPDSTHSVVFDPERCIAYCFANCRGMKLDTFVAKILAADDSEGRDFICNWLESRNKGQFEYTNTPKNNLLNFAAEEKGFSLKHIEPVKGMPLAAVEELYSSFDTRLETLGRLKWSTEEKISAETLKLFDVAYYSSQGSIILPHHNINGEIVGIYQRSFRPLRKEMRAMYPELSSKDLAEYPTGKYLPLVRGEKWQTEEKKAWSFPNSQNLYGLHLTKEGIKKTQKAIIFEGAKSVMKAWQNLIRNSVATHTFGIHENHVNMLIECGAKEIILAFDKQYLTEFGKDWELFKSKINKIQERVKDFVEITIIIDREGLLEYKDSPIDKGIEIFLSLLGKRIKSINEPPIIINFSQESLEERRRLREEGLRIKELQFS